MKERIKGIVNNKVFIIILILLLVCSSFLVGTYAWLTWNSTDNTNLVVSIGKMTDVLFENGNNIEGILNPVFNYEEGLSTEFTIYNRATSDTSIDYDVKFNITTIDSELISEDIKWILMINNEIVREGDLSTAGNGKTIILESGIIPSGTSNYKFYLYMDGNVENDINMMNKSISGNIMVYGAFTNATAIDDFEYYLGSEYSSVDTILYYEEEIDTYYEVPLLASIELEENEVLLARYNGTSKDVVVPDTYIIDGVEYDVVLLASARLSYYDEDEDWEVDDDTGVFCYNKDIESVRLGNGIRFVEDWDEEIVNNSASNLFTYCSNLTSVPVIPGSVTNVKFMFYGCTNLTGTVKINSRNVSNTNYLFYNANKTITVEAPENSVTYESLISADSNAMPDNVELNVFKDELSSDFIYYLGSETSSIDTLLYYDEEMARYYNVPLIYPIELEENEILLTKYIGTSKDVVIPETYTIDGIEYNVVLLSSAYIYYYDENNDWEIDDDTGVFIYNNDIESVQLGNNIRVVSVWSDEPVNDNASYLFSSCSNLTSIPTIPASVTNVRGAFNGCTNLTGTVKINSRNVSKLDYLFNSTYKTITVEVPKNSVTYESLIVADSDAMPDNVEINVFEDELSSNFIYYLGSETSSVNTVPYYYEDMGRYYNVSLSVPIELAENEILLTRYVGSSKEVNIPDTYTIDGTKYNVVLLSNDHVQYWEYGADWDIDEEYGVFMNNTNIESVTLGNNIKIIAYRGDDTFVENDATLLFDSCTSLVNAPKIPTSITSMDSTFGGCTSLVNAPDIPDSVTSMYATFDGCTSLVNAPDIPSSVIDMGYTFNGCTSLVNAPDIPSSVTSMNSTFGDCTSLVNAPDIPSSVIDMGYTFSGCTSLVTAPYIPSSVTNMTHTFNGCTSLINAPDIPDSVVNMSYTFSGCTSLVNAPDIPSSVTNMTYTFKGCTSLVNAPDIPVSVIYMGYTFYGCTSLTGNVKIYSRNVSSINYVFYNTSKPITVEVPAGSTTYKKFNAANSYAMPSNVTLTTFTSS